MSRFDCLKKIRRVLNEALYIFTNYFVANLPLWMIRRWFYVLLGMKIGKKSRILMKTIVVRPRGIVVGDNTVINEYCYLDGRGGLSIGSNTTLAVYTKVLSAYHNTESDEFEMRRKPVFIGDNAVLFSGTMVLPGAEIQDGVVFSASSVVKRGLYKKNTIWAGNPATYVKNREITNKYCPKEWTPIFR